MKYLYQINPKLLFITILILGLIPSFCVFLYFYYENENLNYLEERLQLIENSLYFQATKQKENIALHRHHLNADTDYVSNQFANITFLERPLEKFSHFKESECYLQKPVLVQSQEVIQLLENIEDPSSLHPQLIIQDFQLERIPSLEEDALFKLNIKLLKRDFS